MLEASPTQLDCDADLYQERERQCGDRLCPPETLELEQLCTESRRDQVAEQPLNQNCCLSAADLPTQVHAHEFSLIKPGSISKLPSSHCEPPPQITTRKQPQTPSKQMKEKQPIKTLTSQQSEGLS